MKKLVLATMIAALAFGGIATAQDVGVYFDNAGTQMTTEVNAISILHAYCIASGLTNTGVAGFELQLTQDGPLNLYNFTYPAGSGAINVQSAPTFLVGFSSPLPVVDGAFTLMELDVLVMSANEANWPYYGYEPTDPYDNAFEARIITKEIFFHSLPEPVPAFLDENGEILPLGIAVNDDYRGQGWTTVIGQFGPVATDEASWDGVKSLYR